MKIMVTGGAGFIGSNFIRMRLSSGGHEVICFDKLTYAGNPDNLADFAGLPNYRFVLGDICEPAEVMEAIDGVEAIVNFAAESHVDRSIQSAAPFVMTNILG